MSEKFPTPSEKKFIEGWNAALEAAAQHFETPATIKLNDSRRDISNAIRPEIALQIRALKKEAK